MNNETNERTSVVHCYGVLRITTASNPTVMFTAIAISFFNVPIGIFAVLGNASFMYLYYKVRRLKTAQNLTMTFLASTDLFVGLFSVPIHIILGIMRGFGRHSCLVEVALKIIANFFSGVSLLGILIISFDRAIAVLFPLRRRTWNLKRVYKIYFMCSGFCIILLIVFWQSKIYGQKATRWTVAALILVVLVLIIICYILIHVSLKRSEKRRNNIVQVNKWKKQKKSAVTSGLITFLFFFFYFPRVFINLTKGEEELYHFTKWTALLIHLNSAINPAVFFYRREEIREELTSLIDRVRQWILKTSGFRREP